MSGASGSTARGSGSILPRVCRACSGESEGKKLQFCQRCHSPSYCGRECQKADWPSHKNECKFLQQLQDQAQEAHGDAGACNTRRLTQWITRCEHPFDCMVANLLSKICDTRLLLFITKRYEKRPYFKVQQYKVVPVDKFAVEYPEEHEEILRGSMHAMLKYQHDNRICGRTVVICSNDPMVPVLCLPRPCADPRPKMTPDLMVRLINEEPMP